MRRPPTRRPPAPPRPPRNGWEALARSVANCGFVSVSNLTGVEVHALRKAVYLGVIEPEDRALLAEHGIPVTAW